MLRQVQTPIMDNPTLTEFYFSVIGRVDIKRSKCSTSMNAYSTQSEIFIVQRVVGSNPTMTNNNTPNKWQ